MNKVEIKEVKKDKIGNINIYYDDWDISIRDEDHYDNSITLTRNEVKEVMRALNNLAKT